MTYLDYAATDLYPKYRCSDYGWQFNPNANYAHGEKKLLKMCEERIKKAIGANGGKVIFGGTASQLVENLMNCDRADFWSVGSVYEHDSVDRFLIEHNLYNIEELEETLKTFTPTGMKPFVFWQGVNNVTGRIFDVETIGRLCHKYGAFFVCDMTAMIGHAPIPSKLDEWCDCAFWSGHKIGTELGIGAMWIGDEFNSWLDDFKLYGTPNVVGALAITDATEDVVKSAPYNELHYYELTKMLKNRLEVNGIECDIMGDKQSVAVHAHAINAIHLPGINARALQTYLASKQIYVGIGASACAEDHDYRVLNAFGLTEEKASEVIRVSFGEDSTVADVDKLVNGIKAFKEKYL